MAKPSQEILSEEKGGEDKSTCKLLKKLNRATRLSKYSHKERRCLIQESSDYLPRKGRGTEKGEQKPSNSNETSEGLS